MTSDLAEPPLVDPLAGAPLDPELFDRVCAGPAAGPALRALRDAENALRKQLLLAFDSELRRNDRASAVLPDFDAAWELLLRVEDTHPELVDGIVMFPAVGLWLQRAIKQLGGEFPDRPADRAGIGVLHAVAAAAAVRAGVDCAIRVPVVRGVVSLPTVGRFDVAVDDGVDFVRLTASGGRTALDHGGTPLAGGFTEVRRHRAEVAGLALDVVFDDADPHRAFTEGTSPPDPVDDAEFARWRAQLDEAWSVLVDWHPGYAEELAQGLVSLVPLTREGKLVGASCAAAFGAVALSEKATADDLADALVHELQHSKLNALLELGPLHEPDEQRRFYAPWRDDPRPLNGVLHGIYAFASVVEFWHDRRGRVAPERAAEAEFAFVLRALQVRSAIEDVAATARLTARGRLFLAALSDRLAAREAALTRADRTGPVADLVADHRAHWRVAHLAPDASDVARLAGAWLADRPAPPDPVRAEVADHGPVGPSDRAAALKALALRRTDLPGAADAADAALLAGDVDGAAELYLRRVAADPADDQAWAGLARTSAEGALRRTPEVVRALHREVAARTGTAPDPVRLAAWLADPRR
ncbi:HEXXH motif-containing putative peptide modification protein [Actinosynnema sp. NPDC050436]|uniref:aKG-HExxH-type peptide beta-hydroxylase n=1 Tax=Actinosynnema sp. NPDC050436 TaxID=3155659 RepID=UPI0033EEBA65